MRLVAHALDYMRRCWPRLALPVAAALSVAALLPALQPFDGAGFLAINSLGDGPDALYWLLDPHTRNYVAIILAVVAFTLVRLGRVRYALGTLLTMLLAASLAGAALEVIQLFVERARPEEALGSEVQLSHGRSWAPVASFPSGHMMVTGALAAAAAGLFPSLKRPLAVYVAAVAVTRVMFGAHFPLDVLVGAAVGYEAGLFAVGLAERTELLSLRRSSTESHRRANDALVGDLRDALGGTRREWPVGTGEQQ